jgi:hypothetical protein
MRINLKTISTIVLTIDMNFVSCLMSSQGDATLTTTEDDQMLTRDEAKVAIVRTLFYGGTVWAVLVVLRMLVS